MAARQSALLAPWIIWTNECGEYACETCAVKHAEDAKWFKQSATSYTSTADGEQSGDETSAVWPYSNSEMPEGCIGCGAWLETQFDGNRETLEQYTASDFPEWVLALYRA